MSTHDTMSVPERNAMREAGRDEGGHHLRPAIDPTRDELGTLADRWIAEAQRADTEANKAADVVTRGQLEPFRQDRLVTIGTLRGRSDALVQAAAELVRFAAVDATTYDPGAANLPPDPLADRLRGIADTLAAGPFRAETDDELAASLHEIADRIDEASTRETADTVAVDTIAEVIRDTDWSGVLYDGDALRAIADAVRVTGRDPGPDQDSPEDDEADTDDARQLRKTSDHEYR